MSKLWLFLTVVALLLAGWTVHPVYAQGVKPDAEVTPEGAGPRPNEAPDVPRTSTANEPSPNYRLRPGDELIVTFLGVQDAPYDVKLREDGGFYLPRVGDVHAMGLTIAELRPVLEQRLSKHLLHSQVEIGLKETAPQFAMVFGEVSKPGQIEVAEGTTLVQALSEAGGFTAAADQSEVTVVRNKQTLHVLMEATDEPPTVDPGDVIYVGKAGRVSVSGSVNTPAIVTISGSSATVWEAIMEAGGPKPEAAMSRIRLVRFGATDQADAQGRVLDLSMGPASKDGQLPVANGDSITVPEQRVLFVSVGEGGKTASLPIEGPTNLLDVLVAAGVSDKKTLKQVAIIRAKDVSKLTAGGANPLSLGQNGKIGKSSPAPKADATPTAIATATPTATAAPADATPTTDKLATSSEARDDDPMQVDPNAASKPNPNINSADAKKVADNVEVVDVADALKHGTTASLTTVSDGDVVVVNPPNPNSGMSSWLQWTGIFNMIYYLRYL